MSASDAAQQLSIKVNTVNLLFSLQSKVFIPLASFAGATFIISAVALAVYKRGEKRMATKPPSARAISVTRLTALCLSWASAALILAAAWSVTLSTIAVEVVSRDGHDALSIRGGVALQALQWVVAALTCVYAYGVGSMLRKSSPKPSS